MTRILLLLAATVLLQYSVDALLSTKALDRARHHVALQARRHTRQVRQAEESEELDPKLLLALLGGGGEGGETGGVGGLFCFLGCEDKFDKLGSSSSEESTDGEDDSGMDFDINDFFNHDNESLVEDLPETCADFNDAKSCIDKCGDFPFRSMIESAFRPLVFMCQTNYDEFVKYAPCLDAAEQPEACEEKCGDDDFVAGKQAEVKAAGKGKNFTAILDNMGELCTFADCNLQCMRPSIIESCKDERAADLFEEFIAHALTGVTGMFDGLGLGAMKPESCTAITERAGDLPGYGDLKEKSGNNDQLLKEKLELEITVLELEKEKLVLEKEVLEMQKLQLSKGN